MISSQANILIDDFPEGINITAQPKPRVVCEARGWVMNIDEFKLIERNKIL